MKYLIAMIFTLGILASSFAQKQDFTKAADNDPAATKVLEKVSKKYEAYKSIQATFTLDIEIPEEPVDQQTGKMMTQGEKYNVDFNEYSMISDGKNLWIHSKRNEEVQLNNVPDEEEAAEEGMLAPQDFYSFYKNGKYVYALVNAQREDGKPVVQIEFKPLDGESEYSKIRMTIEQKTSTVKRIKVFSKDGSRYTLTIKDFTPNKKFASTDFKFNKSKFPNVHVEDLRID